MSSEPIEGEVVEQNLPAVQEQPQAMAVMRPVLNVQGMIDQQRELAEITRGALEEGRDYGKIPGAGEKPTLLKPGAERLCAAYGLAVSYEITEREVDHTIVLPWVKRKKKWNNKFQGDRSFEWEEEHGEASGLYRYVVECHLSDRRTGQIVGSGLGMASSTEAKYCDRPRDLENTILKMAQKRALITVVLNVLALSDRFTQDIEDNPEAFGGDSKPKSTTQGQKPAQKPAQKPQEAPAEGGTWREITGKYDGKCYICGGELPKGEPILYCSTNPKGMQVKHVVCPGESEAFPGGDDFDGSIFGDDDDPLAAGPQ